jgi:hypothetical protein
MSRWGSFRNEGCCGAREGGGAATEGGGAIEGGGNVGSCDKSVDLIIG